MREGKDKPFLEEFPQEEKIKARSRIFSHFSATLLGLLFVFSLSQFGLEGLKGILVDALCRLQRWASPHPAIVLIAYDDESSRRYEPGMRIPPEEIAQVLDYLAVERPKAVAMLTALNEKNYSDGELKLIAKHLAKIDRAYVGYTDDESLGKSAPPAIAAAAKYYPGFVSRDTFSYGADGVTRRVMISIDGLPTVYSELARLGQENADATGFKASHAFGRAGDTQQAFIRWQGIAGTYSLIPSEQVALHRLKPGAFTDKIVLFGTKLSARKDLDYVLTPHSRLSHHTTLLEGAAQGLATLLRDDGLVRTPAWFDWLLALLVGVATVNMVLFLSPGRGILFVLSVVASLLVIGWLALYYAGLWINIAHPLVIACVGYYLVIPYRLVDEYRKRWHYQEKSEFMAQLELLKSNFLSLISHDLKTPIARIQGNAELVLNEQSDLSDQQRKCLSAIVHTTDDLSQYVETVLDLTRIESAQVPIQRITKDINATVVEVVESKRFMAQDKNITLVTKLEPLFSIKFDVKLIRRVLSNLVENAIKYSPPNSVITLSSREEDKWIRVAITDQGMGIAPEEQTKVFSKFYRCENESTRSVKGTGLGLYLVKYFVELHQGMVELKSELGKGSEFTVSLPV